MIRRRRLWLLVIALGFVVVALLPALLTDPATREAPLWLAPVGYAIILIGVAGFIWSWIIATRAARGPGDDRYDPHHDG